MSRHERRVRPLSHRRVAMPNDEVRVKLRLVTPEDPAARFFSVEEYGSIERALDAAKKWVGDSDQRSDGAD